MRPYLIFIFLLNIAFANFAHALDGVVSENCSPTKTTSKPSSSVKTSGKEVTVIQTVDSCPKASSGASSQGIELIEKSARFAIDAAGESTKSSAGFAEKTLETVKNVISWLGAFVTILLALGGFLGYKTAKDLRNDAREIAEKHLKNTVADFEEKSKKILEEMMTSHKETLAAKRDAVDSSFEQEFSAARTESILANTLNLEETSRQRLMRSAISNYTSLISKIEKVDLAGITKLITEKALRFEPWDKNIVDDRAFLLGWLYRDKALLQKRVGDLPEALKTVEAATKISPLDWGLIYNLGCYQCLTGNLQGAKNTAVKCLTSPYAAELATWIKSDDDYKAIIADTVIQSLLANIT